MVRIFHTLWFDRVKRVAFALFMTFFVLAASNAFSQQQASLSLHVSPTSGSLDDTYTFSVTVSGTQNAEYPELIGGEDFDVHLVGPQSSVNIINGRVAAQVTYIYQLNPKREGELLTPAAKIKVAGRELSAEGIALKVIKPTVPQDFDSAERYLLRQTSDKESAVVGEQLVLTLSIYSKTDVDDIKFGDLTFDGFWSTDLGELERGIQDVQGERFRVFRLKKALFPLRSGDLSLPSQRANITVRERMKRSRSGPQGFDLFDPFDDSFFQDFLGTRPLQVTLRSNEAPIKVQPLPLKPSDFPDWGLENVIVGKTDLKLDYNDTAITYGESKTVEVEVRSWGNINPIKEVQLPKAEDLRVYQEAPQLKASEVAGSLYTSLRIKLSLIPLRGGEIRIPPLRLGYYDPASAEYMEARTAEIKFAVNGAPVAKGVEQRIQAPPAIEQSTQLEKKRPPYRDENLLERVSGQVSLGLGLILLAAVLLAVFALLFFTRLRKARAPRKMLRQRIEQAATVSELSSAYRHYLSHTLTRNLNSLSTDELRAVLKREITDRDLLYQALCVVDEFDLLLYGGSSGNGNNLPTLKDKVRQVTETL